MDLLRVIQERRSIREYRKDPIPDEIILEVLEAARQSPSWANTQTWRFIIVKNEEVKKLLTDTLTTHNPARNAIANAPCVICVVAKKGEAGFYKGNPTTDKGDWFMFDAGIAMEHLVLAAWNFGLGTCHVGSFDAKKAEELLRIPEQYAMVEMTPIGYFDQTPSARPRKPLKDIVFINSFDTPYIP